MKTKFVVPLLLADFNKRPQQTTDNDFFALYFINGILYKERQVGNNLETSTFLFNDSIIPSLPSVTTGVIYANDQLLQIISKLNYTLNNIELTGTVGGSVEYVNGKLTFNFTTPLDTAAGGGSNIFFNTPFNITVYDEPFLVESKYLSGNYTKLIFVCESANTQTNIFSILDNSDFTIKLTVPFQSTNTLQQVVLSIDLLALDGYYDLRIESPDILTIKEIILI